MVESLGPPLAVGITVVTLLVIRTRSTRTRIVAEGLLLLALIGALAYWGVSPLTSSAELSKNPNDLWFRALAVVWWLLGARVVTSLFALASERGNHARQARLLSDLVAGAIYLTAALVVLNSVLGLQLKGLLATSGLIAILVGLASQNTLADVFSGIAVGLDQPFHIGDRVSIGDQAEGVVVEMNWRSIRVQTDGEDVAMIPNSLVAKGLIINRSVPTPRRAASVDIPVTPSAQPETVIELIRQAVLLSPGLLATPQPSVALKRLGVYSTTFVVNYFVASSAHLAPAKSQLLHQVRRVFRHAGVGAEPALSATNLLSRLALFESLNDDQISQLASKLNLHEMEPKASLYRQGEAGASIFIVQSGVLEVSRSDNSTSVVVSRVGPGEYLGEISMMCGEPHPVSVAALTSSAVLELPRSALDGLLRDDKTVAEALERAVRLGWARLEREDAARAAHPIEEGGSLLSKIGQFLRQSLG
ncbi:MAG TPA: mechanosensitive ion channel family protein [Caulobacteraceae bacterium]|jgi:small-conductance mechanosensitive channel